jgi:hypothetical protein
MTVLNVGFRLGIIDGMIKKHSPYRHVIIKLIQTCMLIFGTNGTRNQVLRYSLANGRM